MAKDFDTMEDSNRSANPSIHEVSDPARRVVLRGGFGAALAGLLGPTAGLGAVALGGCATAATGPVIGFKGVPASMADQSRWTPM